MAWDVLRYDPPLLSTVRPIQALRHWCHWWLPIDNSREGASHLYWLVSASLTVSARETKNMLCMDNTLVYTLPVEGRGNEKIKFCEMRTMNVTPDEPTDCQWLQALPARLRDESNDWLNEWMIQRHWTPLNGTDCHWLPLPSKKWHFFGNLWKT